MSTEQSLYPPTKSCGCVKFVGGRKRRRTRRKRRKHHKKRKTHHRHKSHKRHRTRHRHKRRRTRHRRRRVGGDPLQKPGGLVGGYREKMVNPNPSGISGGGKNKPLIFSDFPPGYKDKAARTAIRKMKHKKKHRKH